MYDVRIIDEMTDRVIAVRYGVSEWELAELFASMGVMQAVEIIE